MGDKNIHENYFRRNSITTFNDNLIEEFNTNGFGGGRVRVDNNADLITEFNQGLENRKQANKTNEFDRGDF